MDVVYEEIDYDTISLLVDNYYHSPNTRIISTISFEVIRHIAYIKLQDKVRADRFIILLANTMLHVTFMLVVIFYSTM